MKPIGLLAIALVVAGTTSPAEVIDRNASGFTSRNTVSIAAPADRVYAMFARVGEWWDPAHTYSGDARNLKLDLVAGGCFCESLPNGGSVQHGVVVYASPGSTLRLSAALGPLQELAASGSLTWLLEPNGTETRATVTYAVGGYAPKGLEQLAAAVDQVIGTQLRRLKEAAERR
jgi:uncharacterized protein YndB with AHSA1/START domain